MKNDWKKFVFNQFLIIYTLIFIHSVSYADETSSCPQEKINNIASIVSNVTWGGVNSVIGLFVIAGYTAAAPFSEKITVPKFTRKGANGRQLRVTTGHWRGRGAVSLGVFQIEDGDVFENRKFVPFDQRIDESDEKIFSEEAVLDVIHHEGGHAYQSALLGPLYLPVVLVNYAIHGGNGGSEVGQENNDDDAAVERWADSWAKSVCASENTLEMNQITDNLAEYSNETDQAQPAQ